MGKDASELVIASNGSISVAPVGTTLPDDPTEALNGAFNELGFATENGVKLTATPTISDFMVWQSRQAIRRELVGQEIQAGFELVQWNAETISLAFGGGEITEDVPGIFRYDFPTLADTLDERALVIDWQDGDKHYRAVFPRGNATDPVQTDLTRSALSILPITFKVLAEDDGASPGYIVSDDPAFGES